MGEAKWKAIKARISVAVDTSGARIQVAGDPEAAITPLLAIAVFHRLP